MSSAWCTANAKAPSEWQWGGNAPDHSVLCRRINRIDTRADCCRISVSGKGRTVCTAVDGTGIIPTMPGKGGSGTNGR